MMPILFFSDGIENETMPSRKVLNKVELVEIALCYGDFVKNVSN